jgi:hypothetical protein
MTRHISDLELLKVWKRHETQGYLLYPMLTKREKTYDWPERLAYINPGSHRIFTKKSVTDDQGGGIHYSTINEEVFKRYSLLMKIYRKTFGGDD